MPNPTLPLAAAYRPDQILLQFDAGSTAAEHSRALEAIGGRLLDIINGDSSTTTDTPLNHHFVRSLQRRA